LADSIYESINWDAAVANTTTGELFMTFDEDGSGTLPLKAFNEYMIVSWLSENY